MKNLSATESEKIFSQIISGEMAEDEIAKFLLALKEKGETADEILGAVKAVMAQYKAPGFLSEQLSEFLLDTCGTGGDGLDTLNISTAAAFVIAGCGVPVMKHGNRAVSSKSGSADVLRELGINIEYVPDTTSISQGGMFFLYAPIYHTAMAKVASIRAKLKTRTIFNLLGPLLNPAYAKHQLIGVYSPNLLRTFAEVLRELDTKKAWIVCGADGLDELSISGESFVCELDGKTIDTFTITPEDAGLKRYDISGIKGGTASENAAAIVDLLNGKSGAYRDIVLLNAAAGLIVAGKVSDLKQGTKLAAESIDNGHALAVLNKLKEITNE